jgi:creatinine amidohydrolase/Fe(II)-dependent formamide hydrolase-like protein
MAALVSRALACMFLIAAPWVARADPPPSVFLEDLTSPELAARIRAGTTTVIVPAGGTEQNGAHMALGKHNVRVKILSERIARALGNAVVAPVIAYVPEGGVNPPTGHMRYPGTITVPASVYRATIESAARSLRLAGFRDIVLIGDSGDYQKDNASVAAKLDKEWAGSPARVHAIERYYRAATAEFFDALRKQGFKDAEIGTHAGLADTSLMLAVSPSLVRADRLQTGEGVSGDPRHAKAEVGQGAVDAIVLQTAAAIRSATQRQ